MEWKKIASKEYEKIVFHSIPCPDEKLVMQMSCRQPQSGVTVRRFCKRKSCCHVIAIPQAGIAAPTLTVMQGFHAKKRLPHALLPISTYCVYTPYAPIPRIRNSSANRTWLRWL